MKPTRERKEVALSVAVVVQGGGSSRSFTGEPTSDGLLRFHCSEEIAQIDTCWKTDKRDKAPLERKTAETDGKIPNTRTVYQIRT
jgi:hypothetical protein